MGEGSLELSEPSKHGAFTERGRSFYGSAFNMAWPRELGIEPKVIVDAGSYDGGDSFRFKQAYPAARVIAIEADPHRADIVRRNLKGVDATIVQCALADRAGRVRWYRSLKNGEYSASGSLYQWTKETRIQFPKVTQLDKPIVILSRTLEDVCASLNVSGIDVLHMDVEGATLDVMRGLGPIRPWIVYSEMTNYWSHVPHTDEIHGQIIGMGYAEMARTPTDRLYFRQ